MKSIFSNWQTTASGLIVIALGAAHSFLGIDIPGFSLDFLSALPLGAGLIFAKDATSQTAPSQAPAAPSSR
jgi:hypothetical protein